MRSRAEMRLLMPVCFDDINYYYKKNVEKNQNSSVVVLVKNVN